MYTDSQMQHSYRRMFRAVTKDMANWKEPITIVIDSDDMLGKNDSERIGNAVRRMGRIVRAIRFMAGDMPCNHVKMHDNADGTGKTLIYRNRGYYCNVGV